jgi:hypothetical protein
MSAFRQPLPNDRRTRQLYIDAAIKRAQARAREARQQAEAAAAEDAGAAPSAVVVSAPAPAVVPEQRGADPGE